MNAENEILKKLINAVLEFDTDEAVKYAKEIGADAYGKDAVEAVQLCRKLVRET